MLTPNIDLKNKSILVTGAAGFIGANLVTELLKDTDAVKIVGLDSMSDYYDVSIKEYRLAEIDKMAKQKNDSQWIFVKACKEKVKPQIGLAARKFGRRWGERSAAQISHHKVPA